MSDKTHRQPLLGDKYAVSVPALLKAVTAIWKAKCPSPQWSFNTVRAQGDASDDCFHAEVLCMWRYVCVVIDAQSSEHQRTVKTSQQCNHCVATRNKKRNVIANHCLKESWQAAEGRRVWTCWEGAHRNQGLKNGHAAQRRLHFTSKLSPQPCIDSATITQVHKLLLMEHTKAQHRQETDMC